MLSRTDPFASLVWRVNLLRVAGQAEKGRTENRQRRVHRSVLPRRADPPPPSQTIPVHPTAPAVGSARQPGTQFGQEIASPVRPPKPARNWPTWNTARAQTAATFNFICAPCWVRRQRGGPGPINYPPLNGNFPTCCSPDLHDLGRPLPSHAHTQRACNLPFTRAGRLPEASQTTFPFASFFAPLDSRGRRPTFVHSFLLPLLPTHTHTTPRPLCEPGHLQ